MSENVYLDGNFERSSVDTRLSHVSIDENGLVQVVLYPRRQTSADWKLRWMEPCFRLKNIKGKKVIIRIQLYGKRGDERCHQLWKENQRGHFSYDFRSWKILSHLEIKEDELILSHDESFTENEVFFARSWPRSVSIVGENILELKRDYPDLIQATQESKKFGPVNTLSFPAYDYIAGEIANCVDEIGRKIPETPFYSFEINDGNNLKSKKNALIMGGVHAGEDVGDLALWEFVKWLLSEEEKAKLLRENYLIRVYPLVNASGRYAGYWRNAPDSLVDTNRQWGFEVPENDCVRVAKRIMVNDLNGERLIWGFDFHAAPGGESLQLSVKHSLPVSMMFYHLSNEKLKSGSFGIYGDVNVAHSKDLPPTITTAWMRVDLKASLSMIVESSEQSGPMSPEKARPYSIAIGEALYQMHESGMLE